MEHCFWQPLGRADVDSNHTAANARQLATAAKHSGIHRLQYDCQSDNPVLSTAAALSPQSDPHISDAANNVGSRNTRATKRLRSAVYAIICHTDNVAGGSGADVG